MTPTCLNIFFFSAWHCIVFWIKSKRVEREGERKAKKGMVSAKKWQKGRQKENRRRIEDWSVVAFYWSINQYHPKGLGLSSYVHMHTHTQPVVYHIIKCPVVKASDYKVPNWLFGRWIHHTATKQELYKSVQWTCYTVKIFYTAGDIFNFGAGKCAVGKLYFTTTSSPLNISFCLGFLNNVSELQKVWKTKASPTRLIKQSTGLYYGLSLL